jgi:hypothetical protein
VNTFVLLYGLEPEWQELGPERLVDVLLLDMHFPEFVGLFRTGPEANPVDELLTYRDKRQKVLDGPITDRDTALEELHRTLPEQFPVWAGNAEFVALVESLRAAPEWEQVRLKLQRRRPFMISLPAEPEPSSATVEPPEGVRPRGRSLVIYDSAAADSPSAVDELALSPRLLLPEWTATVVPNAEEAQRELRLRAFDTLLIRVEREDDPEGGFDDLATVRDLHPGQAILFTTRVTPDRRSRARSMGAHITSDPKELAWLLETSAAPPPPTSGPPAAAPPNQSDLARSLGVLATWLWNEGRHDEALEARREAVRIYMHLVQEEQSDTRTAATLFQDHVQELRQSLDELAGSLDQMERTEEADATRRLAQTL